MKTSIALLLASFIAAGRCVACEPPVEYDEPMPTDNMTEVQVAQLSEEALAGSADAGQALAARYVLAPSQQAQYEYWTTIAAENGHPVAQFNLAQLLLARGGESDKRRAHYWLTLAARGGNERAAAQLEALSAEPR